MLRGVVLSEVEPHVVYVRKKRLYEYEKFCASGVNITGYSKCERDSPFEDPLLCVLPEPLCQLVWPKDTIWVLDDSDTTYDQLMKAFTTFEQRQPDIVPYTSCLSYQIPESDEEDEDVSEEEIYSDTASVSEVSEVSYELDDTL